MKKIASQIRKLSLDREVIRRLSSAELGEVAGGTDVSQGTACRSACAPCTVTGTGTRPKME